MPKFDSLIKSICIKQKTEYFNYSDSTGYEFLDGSHLYKTSGKKISSEIAKRILELQNQK